MRGRGTLGILIAVSLGTSALVLWLVLHVPEAGGWHFADADYAAVVAHGKSIYMGRCASCHGRNLQGQPLWQLRDEYAGRRAPAHDETGHTWQHSDEEIFHVIKYGRFSSVPADAVSFMPAFQKDLGDRDIIAVIAFIKARWPTALRVSQAMFNPGHAGVPPQAEQTEWKFPPSFCNGARRRQAAGAGTPP
ncbi:MAG TPA: cytochrome c [Stellaceae bacterium]|nr:cytochrome c [Stellaceae bacterium]